MSEPVVHQIVFSPAQAAQYAALKGELRVAHAKLEEVQNFLALSVVSVADVPRTTVAETAGGLSVTVLP